MAAVSQFGETVTVGRLRNGQRIRAPLSRTKPADSARRMKASHQIAAAMIEPTR
jgi:hypothetical protein